MSGLVSELRVVVDKTAKGPSRGPPVLTVMVGDHVGHVDFSIGGFGPHAAPRRALVGVPLLFRVVGDVVDDQRLVLATH